MNRASLIQSVVAIAGPGVIILIRLIGQGPSQVDAATDLASEAEYAQRVVEVISLSPGLDEAWIDSRDRLSQIRVTQKSPRVVETNAIDSSVSASGPVLVFPRLSLTAILGGIDHRAAVLNTKIFWVGDKIGDGWVLESVDPVKRTVTLKHRFGTTHLIEFIDEG